MEKPKRRITGIAASLTFVLIFCITSCSSRKKLPEWLPGKWVVTFTDYSVQETWKESDGKFVGVTLWSGKFKTWQENLTMYVNNSGKLVYRTVVEGKATNFVCENMNSDTLVFINNSNGFPKRLHYTKPVGNKMNVWIDNVDNDQNRIDFHFQKIK